MGFCLFNNAATLSVMRSGATPLNEVVFSVLARSSNAANTTTSSTRPLRGGDGGEAFREAFEIAILPRLQEFGPDLIVISAGFDAHKLDPLANLNLSEADLGWATHRNEDRECSLHQAKRRLSRRCELGAKPLVPVGHPFATSRRNLQDGCVGVDFFHIADRLRNGEIEMRQ